MCPNNKKELRNKNVSKWWTDTRNKKSVVRKKKKKLEKKSDLMIKTT